ncbi:MAG TPA: UrcA family protein [Allosphingosinicella sp.]
MLRKLLVAAATLLTAVSTPALAAAPDAAVRYVHFADLDLNSAAGRRTLDRRIDAAVRATCGTIAATNWRASADARSCRIRTRAGAVYPVNFPSAGQAIGTN